MCGKTYGLWLGFLLRFDFWGEFFVFGFCFCLFVLHVAYGQRTWLENVIFGAAFCLA